MRTSSIEDLPVFEGKRDGRIRRGHDLWDSPHGRDDSKLRRRHIMGLLQKHLGQPWSLVLKELQTKVRGTEGETTRSLIDYYVDYETWMENGKVMRQGLWGPAPVEAAYGNREAYYVDPITRTLQLKKRDPRKPAFRIPEEMPSKRPGEKYMRQGNFWYRVFFSESQLEMLKRGKNVTPKRKTTYWFDKKPQVSNKGAELVSQESRVLQVTHKTDHRGFPASWRWGYYLHDWKQVMEANLGNSYDAVIEALNQLPVIYKRGFMSEVYPVEELICFWARNSRLVNPTVKWTPYVFNNGVLETNPVPDEFTESMTLRPTVLQVGGKELDRIKAAVDRLRQEAEEEAEESK